MAKHTDSIRSFRITWREPAPRLLNNRGETSSHHAYADEKTSAISVAVGLRCNMVAQDVVVYSWDSAAQGYTETSL